MITKISCIVFCINRCHAGTIWPSLPLRAYVICEIRYVNSESLPCETASVSSAQGSLPFLCTDARDNCRSTIPSIVRGGRKYCVHILSTTVPSKVARGKSWNLNAIVSDVWKGFYKGICKAFVRLCKTCTRSCTRLQDLFKNFNRLLNWFFNDFLMIFK